jgi:hypothetical protein
MFRFGEIKMAVAEFAEVFGEVEITAEEGFGGDFEVVEVHGEEEDHAFDIERRA